MGSRFRSRQGFIAVDGGDGNGAADNEGRKAGRRAPEPVPRQVSLTEAVIL